MAKRLIAAVLFATVAACSGGGKAPAPCESGAAANEYAVYSAAVEEFSKGHDGKPVVIYDRTIDASDPAGVTSEWMLRCEAFVPEADKACSIVTRREIESPWCWPATSASEASTF